MRLIDADKIDTRERGNNSQSTMWRNIKKIIDEAPTVETYTLEDMQNNYDAGAAYEAAKHDWIPIKTRPLTEEEKQNAIEKHDIDPDDLEYPFAWHFDCELPKLKEGEQSVDVLVTTESGFVKVTNFFIDYLGCPCFEDMDEAGEFVAWMPLPERYEAEV